MIRRAAQRCSGITQPWGSICTPTAPACTSALSVARLSSRVPNSSVISLYTRGRNPSRLASAPTLTLFFFFKLSHQFKVKCKQRKHANTKYLALWGFWHFSQRPWHVWDSPLLWKLFFSILLLFYFPFLILSDDSGSLLFCCQQSPHESLFQWIAIKTKVCT